MEQNRIKDQLPRKTVFLETPLSKEAVLSLKSGDIVKLNGVIYTARDAAHKRMLEEYEQTGTFPFDIKDQVIYYAGPSPAKPGQVIGSAGPTTSYRMDAYAPKLLELGLRAMIGKGARNQQVMEAVKTYGAVYFGATGGAGALISQCIKKSQVIAYEDLGAEAIRRLEVENFPLVVILDCYGNNLYEQARKQYQK